MTCLYHVRLGLPAGPHAYATRSPEGAVQLVFTAPAPLGLGAAELLRRDLTQQTGLKPYLVEARRPGDSFDAMVRAHERATDARLAAGWDCDPEYGWASPDGITESDWEHVLGLPLPEDPAFPGPLPT